MSILAQGRRERSGAGALAERLLFDLIEGEEAV